MTTLSQNSFKLENRKTMTKMLLPLLELTILIITFLSTNLNIDLKTLEIENFKKHLTTKNTIYFITTKQINKYTTSIEI